MSFTMASWVWIWDAARRLEQARRLSADLAVAEERLRFAAELHDIQGHHLQVIPLKSELAARLAEHDAAAAAEHMKAVHELARTALADTREVVRGYRRVSLAAELANAAKVLTAAGIHCPPPDEHASTQLPEQVRRLFGLAVRDATTNVLRHSDATAADLQLRIKGNTAQLAVRNDGARSTHRGGGTGLASLAERFADAGGTLDCTREGEVFDLVGTVPISGNVRA
ncbi:MAG TPA: histidine kinase [Egibacteraceae bacterium]|nr:histidine kinase [Egibacteraceae bacterium]